MLYLRSACAFHNGSVRKHNEDNFVFNGGTREKDEKTGLLTAEQKLRRPVSFGVFDGIGGLPRGEEASLLAADMFLELTAKATPRSDAKELFRSCFVAMQNSVTEASHRFGQKIGTTAVMLCFSGKSVTIGNVGDSRAYLLRHGELRQLTEDHSDLELLERLGARGRAPSLTQYIGIPTDEMELEPYLRIRQISPQDRYILCSDGLYSMLPEESIWEVCGVSRSPRDCAEELIKRAINGGGTDNITVIVCDVREQASL